MFVELLSVPDLYFLLLLLLLGNYILLSVTDLFSLLLNDYRAILMDNNNFSNLVCLCVRLWYVAKVCGCVHSILYQCLSVFVTSVLQGSSSEE